MQVNGDAPKWVPDLATAADAAADAAAAARCGYSLKKDGA